MGLRASHGDTAPSEGRSRLGKVFWGQWLPTWALQGDSVGSRAPEVATAAPGEELGTWGVMPRPRRDSTSPPCSFLWKKWKNLCVGDVVCLRKDSIVPVSPPPPRAPQGKVRCGGCGVSQQRQHRPSERPPMSTPRGGSANSVATFVPHCRLTCSCWPAQSPVACAMWKPQTLMGKLSWLPWGLGPQSNPSSPVAERDSQVVQLSLQGTSVSVPRSESHGPVLTQGQVCCVASDKALSFSGPHLSVDTAGTQQKWSRVWRKYNFSTQGVIHGHIFMTLHLALVPRETNLKFRQALMVTHRELTSPKKMASFQGEGMEAACAPLSTSFAGSIWMVGGALHSSVPVLCLCQPVCPRCWRCFTVLL